LLEMASSSDERVRRQNLYDEFSNAFASANPYWSKQKQQDEGNKVWRPICKDEDDGDGHEQVAEAMPNEVGPMPIWTNLREVWMNAMGLEEFGDD
jgi:hypothetical protein